MKNTNEQTLLEQFLLNLLNVLYNMHITRQRTTYMHYQNIVTALDGNCIHNVIYNYCWINNFRLLL